MLLNFSNNLEPSLVQHIVNFGLDSSFTALSLVMILPELTLFIGLFAIVIISGMYNKKYPINITIKTVRLVSYVITVFSLLVVIILWLNFYITPANINYKNLFFQDTYSINFYTQFLKIVVTISTLSLYKYFNLLNSRANTIELLLLIHICTLLTFIIISSTNFIVLLLALEGFSLALYILTTVDRSRGGIIAAAKYFVFGTLGSILILWGVVHLYSFYFNVSYRSILTLCQLASINNTINFVQSSYNFAIISILLGLLIKLGAAPIHQ